MTPDQANAILASATQQIMALVPSSGTPAATRASLVHLTHSFYWLVSRGDADAAKALISSATNPATSGLSSDQFSALQASILALFP